MDAALANEYDAEFADHSLRAGLATSAADFHVDLVINQFLKAVASGSASQAYYGLTSRELRENVKLQDFKNFLQRFPPLYRNRTANHLKQEYYDKSVGDAAVPGDAVVVKSILESFDGQRNTAEFVLIFEGGQWRVRSVELFPAPPMGAGG